MRSRAAAGVDEPSEFTRAHRKPDPDRHAVGRSTRIVGGGRQEEEASDRVLRSPAQPPGRDDPIAFVPAQRALDRAQVVDLSLDLDYEEPSGRRVIRQDIDPTTRPIATDLDFRRDLPTGLSQFRRDVRRAPGMSWLALSVPVAEEGCVNGDHEARAHRLQQSLRCPEREVEAPTTFDTRNL
jgi:hypothetical protein